jgi:hypothetical protein
MHSYKDEVHGGSCEPHDLTVDQVRRRRHPQLQPRPPHHHPKEGGNQRTIETGCDEQSVEGLGTWCGMHGSIESKHGSRTAHAKHGNTRINQPISIERAEKTPGCHASRLSLVTRHCSHPEPRGPYWPIQPPGLLFRASCCIATWLVAVSFDNGRSLFPPQLCAARRERRSRHLAIRLPTDRR